MGNIKGLMQDILSHLGKMEDVEKAEKLCKLHRDDSEIIKVTDEKSKKRERSELQFAQEEPTFQLHADALEYLFLKGVNWQEIRSLSNK